MISSGAENKLDAVEFLIKTQKLALTLWFMLVFLRHGGVQHHNICHNFASVVMVIF